MLTHMAATATTTPSATPRQRRAWYWYDWANSAFYTTTLTVLLGPYLTSIATSAACPNLADGEKCMNDLSVLGIPIDPGSLHPYAVAFSTFAGALILIWFGTVSDRSRHPIRLLAATAFTGAAAGCGLYFVAGTRWQLGVILMTVGSIAAGMSLVVYDALLCRVASPSERDKVSSRGWALGYLGGGLLLAANFFLLSSADSMGLSTGDAVRISLLSAGLWWAIFTLIPVIGLWTIGPVSQQTTASSTTASETTSPPLNSWKQLAETGRQLRSLPQTMLFLVAYMFFNDGVQTVIGQSNLYGTAELKMPETTMLTLFLLVQFVAFGGALGFGAIAKHLGAKKTVLGSLVMWTLVVVAAYFVPERATAILMTLGVGIGLVLGGTQALSRSMYSQLVPADKEAEFFSFYQALERGTSWIGAAVFGVVHQLTDSYRPSIAALIIFFVVGGVLLTRVDMHAGIRAAGNEIPDKV